ncbi:hypothetical protein ACVW1C_004995 [Bradyrhizobium sp. USDA 4011]
MTAAANTLVKRALADRPLAVGIAVLLAATGLLAVLGWFKPFEPLLRGWLVAFAIAGSVPVGSLIWLMIHRLTGGEWGVAVAPVLRSAAAITPFLIAGFLPILIGLRLIYPWAADPTAVPVDVAGWYLNAISFSLRGLIALAGWSVLAVAFTAGLGSRLLAGLGLALFGLSISLVAVDWYLSLEPHYVATAFAAMIAIQQLLMALAVTALIGPPTIQGKVAGDLGALLIATLLGVVYLEFMTFVVGWYGDLPDKAAWFLKRSNHGWISVLITALAVGALLPFAMLLVQRIRQSRQGLRIAAAMILFGTVLHFVWLLVPAFDDPLSVMAAACAGIAVLLLASYLTFPALVRLLEAGDAE